MIEFDNIDLKKWQTYNGTSGTIKNKNSSFYNRLYDVLKTNFEKFGDEANGKLLYEDLNALEKNYLTYTLSGPFPFLAVLSPLSHSTRYFDEFEELYLHSSIDTSIHKKLKTAHEKGFTKYRIDNALKPNYKNYILFTIQNVMVPLVRHKDDIITIDLVEDICLWAKENKKNVVFRWHPTIHDFINTPKEWWEKVVNKNEYTFFDYQSDIIHLISNCDMLWTKSSSTGFEALLYNKPVAVFEKCDYYPIVKLCKTPDDASNAICVKEETLHQYLTFYCKHLRVDLTRPDLEDHVYSKMNKFHVQGIRDLKTYYYD